MLSIKKQIERSEETPGLPVANHIGDGHHDKNDIKVYGVLACRGSEEIRKDAKQRIIFRLGTQSPDFTTLLTQTVLLWKNRPTYNLPLQ